MSCGDQLHPPTCVDIAMACNAKGTTMDNVWVNVKHDPITEFCWATRRRLLNKPYCVKPHGTPILPHYRRVMVMVMVDRCGSDLVRKIDESPRAEYIAF